MSYDKVYKIKAVVPSNDSEGYELDCTTEFFYEEFNTPITKQELEPKISNVYTIFLKDYPKLSSNKVQLYIAIDKTIDIPGNDDFFNILDPRNKPSQMWISYIKN